MTGGLKKSALAVAVILGGASAYPVTAGYGDVTEASLRYEVTRKGQVIGRHEIDYRFGDDDQITIQITARMRVKFAFITAFRLDHRASELWRDGQLVELRSETRRNKKALTVSVEAREDHLAVITADGTAIAPLDLVPTSFTKDDIWITEGTKDIMLLDTLSGAQRPSTLAVSGLVDFEVNGSTMPVRHYTITNNETGKLSHEFWIDEEGYAMRIHLITKDGQSLFYHWDQARA